jgi:hypothetical protein
MVYVLHRWMDCAIFKSCCVLLIVLVHGMVFGRETATPGSVGKPWFDR